MSSSRIKEVLRNHYGELRELLSKEMPTALKKASFFLNAEEVAHVTSQKDDQDKILELLNHIMTKDNDTCKKFFDTLIMVLPLNFFSMHLESSLMAADDDNLSDEYSVFESEDIPLKSPTPSPTPDSFSHEADVDRKRPLGKTDSTEPIKAKRANRENNSQTAEFTPMEVDSTADQTGAEYLNLPSVSVEFAEDYQSLMMKMMARKYESITHQVKLKEVILDQTIKTLIIKESISKLRERIDSSRDDVIGLQGLEESQDTVSGFARFLEQSNNLKSRISVLLGRAGSGKTKLMHKLCRDWSRGRFSRFTFVFLFEFRKLNLIDAKVNLRRLMFDLFLRPEGDTDKVFRFIMENPDKTLILFDGFDEFRAKGSVKESKCSSNPNALLSIPALISSLLNGLLLPGCTLLITSRPKDALLLPLDAVGQVGEVEGFDQGKIEEYASCYLGENPFRDQALAHLQKHRKMLSMCSTPALCRVIFVCLEHLLLRCLPETKLPQTLTQAYIRMLNVFLSKEAPLTEGLSGTEELLLNRHRQDIARLCSLAENGLQQHKSVFYFEDLSKQLVVFASSSAFLMDFEVKKEVCGREDVHAFVHLTLQEFFGALHYMINDHVTKQMLKRTFSLKSKWVSKNDAKSNFTDTVHVFLSGLAAKECSQFLGVLAGKDQAWVWRRQCIILESLKALAIRNPTGPKIIELCHCVYETQDNQLARKVATSLKFELRNFRLTSVDMTALAYVINSGPGFKCLNIAGCVMDPECIHALADCNHLEVLIFKGRKYEDKFADALSKIIPQVTSLKKLILTCCNIGPEGAAYLSLALEACLHLEEINLHDNELEDAGVAKIVDVLPKMMSLKRIDLGRNNISKKGILIITKAMKTCSSIMEINIGDDGNTATVNFASGFNKPVLHRSSASPPGPLESKAGERAFLTLRLVNCTLAPTYVQKLGAILSSCPRLAELDLSGNELKDPGIRAFLKFLPCLSISKSINLSNNGISETAALQLLQSLKHCPRIAEVQVSIKNVQTIFIKFAEDHEGTEARNGRNNQSISSGNPKARPYCLSKLSLTNGYFQLKQLEELVSALDHCCPLMELDLSNNSLGDKGIKKLVDLLPNLHVSSLIDVSNNSMTLAGVLYLIKYMKKSEDVAEVAISLGKNGRGVLKFHRSCRERESGGSSDLLSREGKIGNLDLPAPKKISLEECKMDSQNMENLCKVINGCPGLTELNLSNNGLNDEVLTKLLNYLPDLQDLKILSINERHISSDTVLLLASSLNICEEVVEVEVRSSKKALIRLSKRGDGYRPQTIPEEPSATFSPHCGFPENGKKLSVPQPRILSVKDCELDKRNVRELLQILTECKDLCRVDLSCNSLGDEGLRCLRDFIPKLNILKLLDVSRNEISPTGVLYLVESLNTCRSVAEVEVSLATNGKSLIKFEKRHEKRICRHGSDYKATQPTSNLDKEGPDRDMCRRISLRDCSFKKEHLTKLSSIVEQCSHLTELDLSCNKLGDLGLGRLVEVVAGLKDLKELDLQKNGISLSTMEHLFETLKCSQSSLNLRFEERWIQASAAVKLVVNCVRIHPNVAAIRIKNNSVLIQLAINNNRRAGRFLSDNSSSLVASANILPPLRLIGLCQCAIQAPQLLELLPVIRMYPHLAEIDLSHNDIGDQGAEELGKILPDVHGLRKLSLESIGTSPAGVRMLAIGLGRCLYIEELNLSRNELGEAGASEMGKVLSQMERLKKINLCRRKTASGSSTGGQLLAKGLSNCIKLEEINLDSLELGDSGVQLLAKGLSTMSHLKKLNLRSNAISSRGAVQLMDGLRGNTEIEVIDLCDNCIKDLGANKLADVLPTMKHLKKLNLTRNNITEAGGSKVVEALGQCPSMQEIHLSTNKTGDQTATRLAQTLPKLPCMKILNLQSNDIGADGGVQLARGLFMCTTIEEISLPENKIGNKGVLELAVALKELRLLKKLDLRLNGVDNCVVEDLAAGLSHCPHVQEIVLSWNSISDGGVVKLAEVLPRMPGLKTLDLERNKITVVGAERLADSLGQCPFIEVIRLWKNSISRDQEQSLQEHEPRLNFSSTP